LKALQSDELDEELRNRFLKLMPFFAICTRPDRPQYDEARTSSTVDLTFWSQRIAQKPRMREAFGLTLKLQQGEWKISGLADWLNYLESNIAHPHFKSEY